MLIEKNAEGRQDLPLVEMAVVAGLPDGPRLRRRLQQGAPRFGEMPTARSVPQKTREATRTVGQALGEAGPAGP